MCCSDDELWLSSKRVSVVLTASDTFTSRIILTLYMTVKTGMIIWVSVGVLLWYNDYVELLPQTALLGIVKEYNF